MSRKRRILILSSLPPEHSAGLGTDLMNTLACNGDEVTYFSRWPSALHAPGRKNMHRTLWQRIVALFISHRRYRKRYRTEMSGAPLINSIRVLYPDERNPQESTGRIARQIRGKYDYIVTLFWQGMFTSETLRHLSRKFKCPVLIYAVDMAPVTGGCYYFNHCERYATSQCGMCPGLDSSDPGDCTHTNFLAKQQNYALCDASFLGNTWMTQCAARSGLFRPDRIFNVGLVMNTERFRPAKDPRSIRAALGIAPEVKHVFFARSADDPRKGSRYVIDAFLSVMKNMTDQQRRSILIITAGHEDTIGNALRPQGIAVKHMGMVDAPTLIRLYQVSTAFISPSTDDAGPSMVNQSLLCGTPVISFATGVALDLVNNGTSGWRIPLCDTASLANAINECIAMPADTFAALRASSRATAMAHNSYEAVNARFRTIFNAYETERSSIGKIISKRITNFVPSIKRRHTGNGN